MTCKNCLCHKKSEEKIAFLRKKMQEKGVQALLIEDPIDLTYLTGLHLSLGHLWVGQKEVLLLVDGRYLESAQKGSPFPSCLTSKEAIVSFLQKNEAKSCAFDGAKTSFKRFQELQSSFSECTWTSFDCITQDLRVIKEEKEIDLLQKSASLLWEGFLHLQGYLKEGITEKALALEFTLFALRHGAEGMAFSPIIAFGENSALPHYRAGDRVLQKGDVVLIDIGLILEGYPSDMTRVLFFGEPDPFLANWLSLTKKAARAALEKAKPGVRVKELDLAAREVYRKEGVEEYFVHSLGHGVGLQVHEFPRIRFEGKDAETILLPGMVMTVEPGLYLPGKGGVRYEDTIVITKEGYRNFFHE